MMILRLILNITTGISVLRMGLLFDFVLILFWVGAIGYFIRSFIGQKIYYIVVAIISSVLVIGDSVYYDYFGIISSKTSLAGISFLTEGQTLEYDISIPLVAYLITPLLVLVIVLIVKNKKKDVYYKKDFGILSLVFVGQILLFLIWGNMSFETRLDYYRSDAYLFETMHDRALFSEKYGYYNYHLLDISRFHWPVDEDEQMDIVDAFFEDKEDHVTNDMTGLYEDYNVVTILAESMDTRFISEALTPNLYMMLEEGYSFDNYFTPVFQQGATCNSEYMSISGLEAITTNDWSNNVCDAYATNVTPYSMAQQLRDNDYDTYYFHSGYEWFYNRNVMIPNYGFETVKFQEDMYDLGYDESTFVDRYDTDMIHFVDEFVDLQSRFYINFLTYSGHGAYNQEDFDVYLDQVNEAYPDNDFDYELINYMEKMVELDTFVGLLLSRLETAGVLDQTLIAIYPDHDPYMLDHDLYTEFIGMDYSDFNVHRQSLILYNSTMTSDVIHKTGSTVDIAPTILNLVYSDAEFGYFMGQDLFSEEDNYAVFSDYSITDGIHYYRLEYDTNETTLQVHEIDYILEEKINVLEIQKMILYLDYFKKK
jgi:phosphoglycerol transferase MdoB-like AlkP superfamily enzyme